MGFQRGSVAGWVRRFALTLCVLFAGFMASLGTRAQTAASEQLDTFRNLSESEPGRERQQVENLARRLQADLTVLARRSTQTGQQQDLAETLAAGQSLSVQLQAAQPTGRLVIDLPDAFLPNRHGENDIELRDGDRIIIPQLKQYVIVIGQVQNATTHVYKSKLGRQAHIESSGDSTARADKKRVYVVKAEAAS